MLAGCICRNFLVLILWELYFQILKSHFLKISVLCCAFTIWKTYFCLYYQHPKTQSGFRNVFYFHCVSGSKYWPMYTITNFDIKKGFIYFSVMCMNIFPACIYASYIYVQCQQRSKTIGCPGSRVVDNGKLLFESWKQNLTAHKISNCS